MAFIRLFLYAASVLFNFSVALALWRLRPWLAKLFAFSLFSSVVTAGIYATLLMEKLGWFKFGTLTSEIMFTVSVSFSALSAITLAVMFFRKNIEAGRGI